jgi:hypothetical protein
MLYLTPIINGIYEWLAEDNDDNDVTIAKGLLGLLGYGRRSPQGPSCFASTEFFDEIRNFQNDQGLKVDGVIAPNGETARAIDELASDKLFADRPIDDSWGDTELDKKCAHLLVNVDGPVCRRLGSRSCWESANRRYTACLAGTPLDELPPLTWDNRGAKGRKPRRPR